MQRIVVTLLAAIVVATPLGAQADTTRPTARDSVQKDSIAKAKAALKPAMAGGEVALPNAAAKKDSTKPTDLTKALTTPTRTATFKCKDGTQSFDADSAKACTTNGGVDSVYKKAAPKP